MADIFLSYAREDAPRAGQIVDALEHQSWTVWWDRRIQTGSEWRRTVLPELEQARCVVVLWSDHAAQSDWVIKEARAAVERTVLVPARLGDVSIPRALHALQVSDLRRWRGDRKAA